MVDAVVPCHGLCVTLVVVVHVLFSIRCVMQGGVAVDDVVGWLYGHALSGLTQQHCMLCAVVFVVFV